VWSIGAWVYADHPRPPSARRLPSPTVARPGVLWGWGYWDMGGMGILEYGGDGDIGVWGDRDIGA
jgi:hypothetical protein